MVDIHFNQALYEACPTGMLAIDNDICIRWINPALETMLNLEGNELIGKDKTTLPESLHALFDETDILHLSLNDEGERWLYREVKEVTDGTDMPLRLHFYQDISPQVLAEKENDQLRKKVDDLTITDPLTGMANRKATLQAIAAQVTRTRRYGNPLTLGAMRLNHPDMPDTPLPDVSVLSLAHYLRERLRWADIIGRYESELFLLLMPETDREDAENLLQQIIQECQEGALSELDGNPVPELAIGVATWEKGDDPQRLIQRTLEDL
ncbi:MAG: diguanylate cyclase [Candidatus Thiodiazotropha sp. (ex Notomyrtea botanica)]|nr:diguanylate cyclase [Candidatus Thiodiazotropha sp. (ex Notomyrtea botanica)]